MYQDLNQIATLRFNRELESISGKTREIVREMQTEYASLTNSLGVRSGPQVAAIGRAQIEGAERLVHALFDIWVDLIKRRNGYISHLDVDFIVKKLEDLAHTQKGHLYIAFSSQKMGAVVNLLTEEAGRRLYAVTANARRDLTIMAHEHELFSQSEGVGKKEASEAAPSNGHERISPCGAADLQQGHEIEGKDNSNDLEISNRSGIWPKIWSWGVVGSIDLFVQGGGIAFMTTGHARAADAFYVAGAVLFLIKFWTWEDARRQLRAQKLLLQIGITLLTVVVLVLAILWNRSINLASSAPTLTTSPTVRTEAKGSGQLQTIGSGTSIKSKQKELPRKFRPVSAERQRADRMASAPSPPWPAARDKGNGAAQPSEAGGSIESKRREPSVKVVAAPAGGQTISIAERVTVIIAHQLDIAPDKIKPSDDFEVDLGASPSDVYFIMQELEQQYDIQIPPPDSKKLNTVGETITYIEKQEHAQQ